MKRVLYSAMVGLMTFSAADAAETVVTQKDRQFDVETITGTVGDTIVFRNDDNVAHNVHSATNDHRFNLDLQEPGESAELELTRPGSFDVRCAIHPRMKLKVTVK